MKPSDTVTREVALRSSSGYPAAAVAISVIALCVASFTVAPFLGGTLGFALRIVLIGLSVFALVGLYMLQPNEAAILTLFGRYTGTDRTQGLHWANPLAVKDKISLRPRNLNGSTPKVNDKRGNPVEINAVVVWRVRDPSSARARRSCTAPSAWSKQR